MSICVLGLDTGMANFGWVVGHMDKKAFTPLQAGVLSSDSNAKKLNIKAGDDDWARSVAIANQLNGLLRTYEPRVITCEAISHVRNSSAMAKIGRVFGIIAMASVQCDLPVLHATPQEIKLAICGKKDASKDDIADALDRKFHKALCGLLDRANISRAKDGTVGKREHAYDALGSIVTCWDHDTMRTFRQVMR